MIFLRILQKWKFYKETVNPANLRWVQFEIYPLVSLFEVYTLGLTYQQLHNAITPLN